MYYLSVQTVSNAYSGILRTKTPNKFWGLLSILHEIDSYPIKTNYTYTLPTKGISLWLDEILYFGNDKKDYGERDCFVRFPNEWIENIADPSNGILKNDRINILDVACFVYKLTPLEKKFSSSELIAKLMKDLNLSEEIVSSWFVNSHYELSYEETPVSKSAIHMALKDIKKDLNDCVSFETPIKSRPGEITRAPFMQTLYAATNALKCLMFATFNLEELYPTSKKHNTKTINMNLQQIFYGAPGTGKSHSIKDYEDVIAAEEKNLVFRTTFHPDSDYSTFVGCYKPTMRPVADRYKAVAGKDEEIAYSFVPQAFLHAYVAAWNNPYDKVFLVIEEINRGNCAQIFGDLFQLLDRDENGCSEYPIIADKDLAKYLNDYDEEGLPVLTNKEGIKDGKLKLPKNLYIWATMNTSDQSLFPIDSAFKRRWEWKYMKIKNEGKEWKIDTKIKDANDEEHLVKWWDFIHKVNDIIASMTSSADKQLGYFFCKADKKTPEMAIEPNSENDLISIDTFVSKVLFYLWNDVFKDYGFEDASLFQYTKMEDGKETKKDLTFPDFYEEDSNDVNPTMVTDFVQKVMNWKKKEEGRN